MPSPSGERFYNKKSLIDDQPPGNFSKVLFIFDLQFYSKYRKAQVYYDSCSPYLCDFVFPERRSYLKTLFH